MSSVTSDGDVQLWSCGIFLGGSFETTEAAKLKRSPPAIRYLGDAWGAPYADASVADANGLVTKVVELAPELLSRAPEAIKIFPEEKAT